nr:hypothetical protein [Tanacetum cinerariifolium]
MVPFYKNELGFTIELKTSSSFKINSLLQPWKTLCKIFSKCLTTRVTGWDQLLLYIMQMMYHFINNIHVDYVEILWEGNHYSLHHSTSLIPYPIFTKIIIGHYMTNFPEISREIQRQSWNEDSNLDDLRSDESHVALSDMVEGQENVIDDSSIFRNDEHNIPSTRLEPKSDKESLEVEFTNVVISVNVNKEEEEITDEVYELK